MKGIPTDFEQGADVEAIGKRPFSYGDLILRHGGAHEVGFWKPADAIVRMEKRIVLCLLYLVGRFVLGEGFYRLTRLALLLR